MRAPLPREEFESALRELSAKYWDKHPFYVRLHAGESTPAEICSWVANRWYYQRNLSQKNAAIIANRPLPEVRRRWVERILFQDGSADSGSGLADWQALLRQVHHGRRRQARGHQPPVLYRRWSDRDELVRATIAHTLRKHVLDVPYTGSLREDALTLMREINAIRLQLVTVISVYLASYHQQTGVSPSDLLAPSSTGRKEALDVLFDRAVERGEIRPERLSERIKSLPFDLLRQVPRDLRPCARPRPRRDHRYDLPPSGALSRRMRERA